MLHLPPWQKAVWIRCGTAELTDSQKIVSYALAFNVWGLRDFARVAPNEDIINSGLHF